MKFQLKQLLSQLILGKIVPYPSLSWSKIMTQANEWIPIRKIAVAALSAPLWALLLAFAPNLGINLNIEQKDALKGFIYAAATLLGTAYMTKGEPLAGSTPTPTPTPNSNPDPVINPEENSDSQF